MELTERPAGPRGGDRTKECGHEVCGCPERLVAAWPSEVRILDGEGDVIEAAERLRDVVARADSSIEELAQAAAEVAARMDALDALFAFSERE